MSRLPEKRIHSLYRGIYEAYTENFRIKLHGLADNLGVVRNTASCYLRNAYNNEIIFPPQLRLKMFAEVKEYVYALKVHDEFRTYEGLKCNSQVFTMEVGKGIFDLLVITSLPLDLEEIPVREVVFSGERSDYVIPFIPDIDCRTSLEWMRKKGKETPMPSSLSTAYPNREILWTNRDWDIFQLIRYDASRTYTEIARKTPLHSDAFAESLTRILPNTISYVPYYPKGHESYMSWTLIFKSEYELFLIDLLSYFPCTTVMYKVADWLVAHIKVDPQCSGSYLRFFSQLEDQGYIDTFDMGFPAVYWHPD
jgi:hypothetical protein